MLKKIKNRPWLWHVETSTGRILSGIYNTLFWFYLFFIIINVLLWIFWWSEYSPREGSWLCKICRWHEPVSTRVLNPNASGASYKPKQRSYRKTKLKKLLLLLFFFLRGFWSGGFWREDTWWDFNVIICIISIIYYVHIFKLDQ